jgi:ABC-type nitrate/sulfonate/bicarbonate transport system permease component
MSNAPSLDPAAAEAVKHLLGVWFQYGGGSFDKKLKAYLLPHQFMSLGEDAAAYLIGLGLGVNAGWYVQLTEAGAAILDKHLES